MPEPTYYIAGLFRQANDTLARSYLKISTGAGGVQAISAGVNSTSSGTVVFSNANNVSFGMNGAGVVTAIANTVGGGAITNVLFSAGTYSTYRSDITFDNSNGITFGQDTAGVITATVRTDYQSSGAYLTTAALSQDSSKYAGTGFTTATTAGTNIVGTLNTAGLSMGIPAYLTTATGGITAINLSAGTTSSNISAFTFSNGSGVTFGFDGSNVTASVQTNYLTTAMASDRGTDFVQATAGFHGTNASGTIASSGISVSVAPPTAANINISAGTTSSNVTAVTFSNANNVSFGYDGSNVTASVTVASTQDSIKVSAGTLSANRSDLTFGDSNGVSWGLNTNGVITGTVRTDYQSSGAYLTTFSFPRLDQVLDLTVDKLFNMGKSQVQFQWNAAGSFSTNATRQGLFELDIVGNLTDGADVLHVHQSVANPTADLLHLQAEGTNARPLHILASGSTGMDLNKPIIFTTDDTAFAMGTVPFIMGTVMSNSVANLNANFVQGRASSQLAGLGFTTATTAGTAVVGTLSTNGLSMGVPAFLTTAQASGNYAGTATSVVTTSGTDLTFALNTNGETIAYPKWITTYVNDLTSGRAGVGASVATTTGTDLTLGVDTAGVTIGYPKWITTAMASDAVTLSNIKVSAGASSSLVSAVTFSNGSGVSFGYDGTNITASVKTDYLTTAAQSSAIATLSYWANGMYVGNTSTAFANSNSWTVVPISVPVYVSASYMRLLVSMNFQSDFTATSNGGTFTFSKVMSANVVWYTMGAGGSSRSLQYFNSTSAGLTWLFSASCANNPNASQQSHTQRFTFPQEGAINATTSTQYITTVTNVPCHTSCWSNMSNRRYLDIPFATLITPGVYWLAMNQMTASTGGGTSNFSFSTIGYQLQTDSFANIGAASSSSNIRPLIHGQWTTNTQQTTSSMALSDFSQTDQYGPFIQFIRQA